MAGLSELDTLRTYPEWGREWRVFYDVPQEKLPAGAVAIAHRIDVRHLLPLLVEHHRLRPFWVEERLRCGDQRLMKQRCRPHTAEPLIPSTWICKRSSRLTRLAQDELTCASTPPDSSNIAKAVSSTSTW